MKAAYLMKSVLDGASWAAGLNLAPSARWPAGLAPAPDVIVYLDDGQLEIRQRARPARPYHALVASIFNVDDLITVVLEGDYSYALSTMERV